MERDYMERTPFLDKHSQTPLYVQLYEYFKREIEEQKILAGMKLPSIRQLSLHLKVSRNTVETAYHQLIAEGYIESKPKSGLHVLEIDLIYNPPKSPQQKAPENNDRQKPSTYIDFQYGDIEMEKFPMREWRRCLVDAVDFTNTSFFTYGDKKGHPGLREEIANYLFQARGVDCDAEDIVLCAGTQQSVQLLCQLLGLSNQKVAIENPGYDGVRYVFEKQKCKVIPISLDSDGVVMDEVERSQAKALYLTPSHQFPLGMVLSISKRMRLLQWASTEDCYLIEDDYDSEFRYQGQPIPSLKSLDHQDRVIYLGTFSKAFLPATRVSYIVLPKELMDQYNKEFSFLNQSVSPLIQEALYLFMKNGYFAKHIRKMRKIYQEKQKKLIECLHKYFGDQVTIIGQRAGLHLLIQLQYKDISKLILKASNAGVTVYPTKTFWMNSENMEENCLMLGYGGLTKEEIEEGIKRLNSVWFG